MLKLRTSPYKKMKAAFCKSFLTKLMGTMQDYIYTIHPKDRISVKMKREHYRQVSAFILSTLNEEAEVTILELIEKANFRFGDQFKGETAWYIYGVKLDMEARGLLKNKRCERTKINYIVKPRRVKSKKLTDQFAGNQW